MRRRAQDERGAVAVEFALVMPLLMMIFFGLITFGFTYNDTLSIANATREGARLGAALDYNTDPSAWATSIQTRVTQTYFNNMSSLNTAKVCVQLVDPSGSVVTNGAGTQATVMGSECTSTAPPTLPSGMASGSCAVRVWVVKGATLSWLLVPDKVFNLNAGSVAYYGLREGSCTSS